MHPQGAAWLRRRAENVLAGLLGVMFAAFIVQIVFRYFFNFPTGWTSELTVVTWLWMVLWGAAFVAEGERGNPHRSRLRRMVGRRDAPRHGVCVVASRSSSCIGMSLPATCDLRHLHEGRRSPPTSRSASNWLYSIYLVFAVAVIVRYLWLLSGLLRGKAPEEADPTKTTSGL